MTLAQMSRFESAEIIRVEGSGPVAQRLLALGFLPGGRIRVVQVAPFGDPIAVEINGWRMSLRRAEAASVTVSPEKNGRE